VRSFLGFVLLVACSHAFAADVDVDYLSRAEVRAFIDSMHLEHGLERAEIERVLGEVRYQPTVVRLIGPERPKPTLPVVRSYPAYRAKFLTRTRIAAGVQYWDTYGKQLSRAEIEFGVPAEVILGILGVETAFGQNTGSFRVVDALATIAFDGPRRQDYFREELKELLLLARDTGFDPLAIKGSYAGAMGLPQFMPSSYRRYAVDFDRDGVIDLARSPADAIGSVASYLSAHGWNEGEPAMVAVTLPAANAPDLVTGLERTHRAADLKQLGVKFSRSQLPNDACSVVELPVPGKASKYHAGFANFAAVTAYNRSTFYATAVLELADAIRKSRAQQVLADELVQTPKKNLHEGSGNSTTLVVAEKAG
jgi:membrane-bound lytic murein transglycosylase B